MKKIMCTIALFGLLFITGCGLCGDGPSIERRARAMIVAGFEGTNFGDDKIIIEEIEKGLGGVILFDFDVAAGKSGRNIESPSQVKELISKLQAVSEDNLLVAIDQEGGRVCRLKEKLGFYCMPSAGRLGEKNKPDLTYELAAKNASQLRELGINLNFAPVVDLNTNPDNPVIGGIGRSFGEDPQLVIEHSREFIEAHTVCGINSCIKHFPGHGSSKADSHKGFVDVTATWNPVELEPYRRLIAGNTAPAVMTAHVFNAKLDPDYPATLSKPIVTGLLRGELGFHGVIFSDDMQMGAIADNYGLEFAIVEAINAGVDMLIFSNNSPTHNDPLIIEKAVKIITQAVKSGQISEERLSESYLRIKALKNG
jgi:beta-N-acetylhexosaminidase